MAITKINKKTSELSITITADKKEWKEAQEKSFKKLSMNLELKGFRKGHVPENIAKQNISGTNIITNAMNPMLDVLVKKAAKEIKEDLMILDSPTYKVDKVSNLELEITFVYPIYPEVKLMDYSSLGIKYKEPVFDKKIVDKEIKRIQEMQATLQKKEGSIENGDTVVFDFEGFSSGEPFEGGKAEKYTLEIGSKKFIEGFEEQMIGMNVGDKKDINVTFPKEYQEPKLKGKDVIFKIELHEIKSKQLPELNEAFVKSTGVKDITTIEELKSYIEKVFKEEKIQESRKVFQNEVFEKISKETEINIPSSILEKEIKKQENKFIDQIKQQGLTMDKYLKSTGMKEEVLKSQFKSTSEKQLKDSFIFAEIAKKENVKLTDKDYEQEYSKLSKVYGQDEESIKKIITKEQMQIPMTNDKVIDILMSKNK